MNLDHVSEKLNELKQGEAVNTVCDPPPIPGTVPPAGMVTPYMVRIEPPLPPLSLKIREDFSFFGLSGIMYAAFFCFCLYRNLSGITAPLFALGTLIYFFLCLKKLEVKLNKDCIFYGTAIMLLGINLCMTDDEFIIFFDYVGICLLLVSGLLSMFYESNSWGLMQYFSVLARTLLGSLDKMDRAFSDMQVWNKKRHERKKENRNIRYIVYGVLIGLPIVVVVSLLLSSADMVFGHMFDNIFGNIFNFDSIILGSWNFIHILLIMAAVYLLSYGLLVNLCSDSIKVVGGPEKTAEPLVAITINTMLAVIYVIFSVIQILYLFMGNMTLPEQYTYAAYARQGFFQLLIVCIINMFLVLICLYKFKENSILKILLNVISGCTYIMIASSVLRMHMYIEAYDLTYLRVLVLWTLCLIFFLMGGIVLYIYRKKFPLFKYSMVVVTVLYLALAYAHPEYLIAACNLDENHIDGNIDYNYLNNLSADAMPAIAEAVEREAGEEFTGKFERFFDYNHRYHCFNSTIEPDSIREFNFSRNRMRRYLEEEWKYS